MKLNAGDDVGRSDEFLIDPKQILVDDALNGRWQPHDDQAVENMAKSFSEEGQLQAVQVRRVHDNRVQLVLGYRRFTAAKLFNERHPEQPMKLKCKVVVVNEEEAFRRNIVENRERAECSPVDDAHNDVQKLVHDRKLSVQAATGLADLAADDQKQILTAGQSEGLTTQSVVKQVRDKKIEKGKGQSRTLSEVRVFLEGLTGSAEVTALKEFAEDFLKFVQGKIKDDTMEKRLRNLLAHEPQNAPVSPAEPETAVIPHEPDQSASFAAS